MQLESHATPPRESPQQRYANLHRAIERGLDSDEVWKELAEVSLAIGHGDEAVRCMRRIRNDPARYALESRLSRLGLVAAPAAAAHSAVPAGKHVGPAKAGDEHVLRDHVVDAFQYLFHQHMPWLVLLTTLAFPLVVGVGGFLTAGGSPLLLTAIAALPGLCVVALVGAMGRHILLASAEGNGDVPPVPGFTELVTSARAFLSDAALVLGSLIGPSLLAMWLGAPLSSSLPGLAIGAFFVPMAWSLRHLRGTIEALSPVTLVRSIARSGFSYVGIAAVSVAMFLPAAGVAWIAFGRPVWVQIAIIGPLCVVPLFLTSRLLGTWLDVKRATICVRQPGPKPAPAGGKRVTKAAAPTAARSGARTGVRPAAPTSAPSRAPTGAPTGAATGAPGGTNVAAPRQPRRPEALEHFKAPVVGRHAAQRAAGNAAPVPAPAPASAKPAPRAIEGRVPSARSTEPAPVADLPGRVVVSGLERHRQGAASKRP